MAVKQQLPALKIEMVARGNLVPYARNARTHSEQQVNQIAASIREFGFTNPVLVDEQNGLIAGHGRLQAAIKLGMDELPCIRLVGLSEAQKRALVLADNKLAMNAGWDLDLLKVELTDLDADGFNLELTGFSASELVVSMGYSDKEFMAGNADGQSRLDQKKPTTCPSCGHEF